MRKIILAITLMAGMLFAAPVFATGTINVNVATSEQLQAVKGIGPKTANAIIAYRTKHGDFSNVSGLTRVKGIGDKKLKKIEAALTVGEAKKK